MRPGCGQRAIDLAGLAACAQHDSDPIQGGVAAHDRQCGQRETVAGRGGQIAGRLAAAGQGNVVACRQRGVADAGRAALPCDVLGRCDGQLAQRGGLTIDGGVALRCPERRIAPGLGGARYGDAGTHERDVAAVRDHAAGRARGARARLRRHTLGRIHGTAERRARLSIGGDVAAGQHGAGSCQGSTASGQGGIATRSGTTRYGEIATCGSGQRRAGRYRAHVRHPDIAAGVKHGGARTLRGARNGDVPASGGLQVAVRCDRPSRGQIARGSQRDGVGRRDAAAQRDVARAVLPLCGDGEMGSVQATGQLDAVAGHGGQRLGGGQVTGPRQIAACVQGQVVARLRGTANGQIAIGRQRDILLGLDGTGGGDGAGRSDTHILLPIHIANTDIAIGVDIDVAGIGRQITSRAHPQPLRRRDQLDLPRRHRTERRRVDRQAVLRARAVGRPIGPGAAHLPVGTRPPRARRHRRHLLVPRDHVDLVAREQGRIDAHRLADQVDRPDRALDPRAGRGARRRVDLDAPAIDQEAHRGGLVE
ncbi:hypothetical protein L665_00632 [Ralstonia solanacearum SD54]|nr:hypothetical protein L665_00632 [Ralstonia solanacearum SD54]